MKKIIKDAIALFLITVVAGALLGLVYQITKNAIAEQELKTKAKAYESIFGSLAEANTGVTEVVPKQVELSDYADILEEAIKEDIENCGNSTIQEAYSIYDSKEQLLGVAVTVLNKDGYGGDLVITVGINMESIIQGVEILTINETAGLGMKAKTDTKWRDQFIGKKAINVYYTKSGNPVGQEIDAISSATYTTKAMVFGVNAGIITYDVIGGALHE